MSTQIEVVHTEEAGEAGSHSAVCLAKSGKEAEASKPLLEGKRVGMVVFSSYPSDPRPRRAAEALLKEGVVLDLICESEEKLPKRERTGRMEIVRLPIKHFRGGRLCYFYQYSTFTFLSACILAWRSLWRRYDLIHIHNMPDVLVFSALVPKLLGAKVILDQHDPMPELMETIFSLGEESFAVRLIRRLEKLSIGFADLVITVNVACKRIFAERSCRPEKIEIVMNSPDGEIFPYRATRSYPLRKVDSNVPFVIMYHGSLVERNGLDLAIDALALVKKNVPNAELKICGRNTRYFEQVMAKVDSLGLADCVRFLGPKRLEELVGEIETCDLGIIPNQRNPFTNINTPTRIFEYLALGKPVIAPRTAGIQDYFDDASLLFFGAGNVHELADKIVFAACHPAETMSVAERGQRVYAAHLWEEERRSLITSVCKLLQGRKSN